jgi:hypothetical protein
MPSTPVLTERPSHFMQDPPASAFLFPAIPAAAALLGLSPGVPGGEAAFKVQNCLSSSAVVPPNNNQS